MVCCWLGQQFLQYFILTTCYLDQHLLLVSVKALSRALIYRYLGRADQKLETAKICGILDT
jgi:hypothetical protein